ncbi:MAG: hypothetical protein Fur0044_43040 [Anaerolineae bacterium]
MEVGSTRLESATIYGGTFGENILFWYHVPMTQQEKLRRRLEQNPKTVRFEDIDRLLQAHGFQVRQPRSGSSHHFYKRGQIAVSVPRRRPYVLPIYVKLVLEAIDRAEKEANND